MGLVCPRVKKDQHPTIRQTASNQQHPTIRQTTGEPTVRHGKETSDTGGLVNNGTGSLTFRHRAFRCAARSALGDFKQEQDNETTIDDYGSALVGTNTIDLYKPSRLEMKRWGVRHVDIDILQWGSEEQSIKVLKPRAKHTTPRRMLIALASKKKSPQLADREL